MSESSPRAVRVAAAVFFAVALVRILALVRLGQPAPPGTHSDVHVYLELAQALFRDGVYETKLAKSYPPLYPLLIAPVFALGSNAARFAAIYVLHGLLLSAGALALLPMLQEALGRARGWWAAAGLQLLFGAFFHGLNAQSETLFTALVCAATGLLWGAVRRPVPTRWVLLGLSVGLAIATRRIALVLPAALAGVALADAVGLARRRADRAAWGLRLRAGLFASLGLALGLVPELLGRALAGGEAVGVYHDGVAGSHLAPLLTMWEDGPRFRMAVRVAATQLLYPVAAFGGAPLLLAAAVLRLRPEDRPPAATSAAGLFALLTCLGLAAMSTLHILRFAYPRPEVQPWDLYPRYLDPAETICVAAAVAAAAWCFGPGRDARRKASARLAVLPFVAAALGCAQLAAPVLRPRGGRLPYFETALAGTPFEAGAGLLLPVAGAAVALAAGAWWWSGRAGRPATTIAAAAVGGLLSLHAPLLWAERGFEPPPLPAVLRAGPLVEEPGAPLAVMTRRVMVGTRARYLPAFRSDHEVWWLRRAELGRWLKDHPTGFVLTHRRDGDPPRLFRLVRVAKTANWSVWAPRSRGLPSIDDPVDSWRDPFGAGR